MKVDTVCVGYGVLYGNNDNISLDQVIPFIKSSVIDELSVERQIIVFKRAIKAYKETL